MEKVCTGRRRGVLARRVRTRWAVWTARAARISDERFDKDLRWIRLAWRLIGHGRAHSENSALERSFAVASRYPVQFLCRNVHVLIHAAARSGVQPEARDKDHGMSILDRSAARLIRIVVCRSLIGRRLDWTIDSAVSYHKASAGVRHSVEVENSVGHDLVWK